VQGLTEFIPVSSSGHLLLAHEVFGTSDNNLAFDVALHGGTLLALLVYFKNDLYNLTTKVFTDSKEGKLARLLLVATIPAALAGLFFNGFIEDTLRSSFVVGLALTIVGILMLVADRRIAAHTDEEVTREQGLKVGFAQVLALIPGVSRSGITMTAGLFAGMSRVQAARFSFLLAIPIIAGSAFGVLIKGGLGDTATDTILIGILTAFLSGLLAIKFMLKVIANVGLKPFAIYRIALGVVVLLFLAI